jgi:Zn-finger nucleic acid-binding protein
MTYHAQTAVAYSAYAPRANCDDVQSVSSDFRDLIIEQCPRCAGTGHECMMDKINEIALEPEGTA